MAGEASVPLPDFKEVYEQVRTHLAGATDAELNRAAVEGFLSVLAPKVILESSVGTNSVGAGTPVTQVRAFDKEIAYIRLAALKEGAAKAVRDAYSRLAATNKLKGVVVDLRYSKGNDYAAAADIADLFVGKEKPLLDFGQGMIRAKSKTDAITQPVAVLVNHETRGAAEALAAVLRATGAGLVLGSKTAGQAMVANEFPLNDGQRLRIATAPIELGDGTKLSSAGVQPDISIEVSPEHERAYYSDAFRVIPATNLFSASTAPALTNQLNGTNPATRRSRYNEAELVRERREGLRGEADIAQESSREPDSDKPIVHDPVLGRAIDVLKGLAVVRSARS